MQKIHLICGPVGAGKTTYAIKLAEEIGGVRFSIDDWMRDLFLPDLVDPISYEWAIERTQRCETRIVSVSSKILRTGTDVIWDLGLMEIDQRRRLLGQAKETGYEILTYYLDAAPEVRFERVERRNREKPQGFAFEVSRWMFDFMEGRFVEPTSEEMGEIITIAT